MPFGQGSVAEELVMQLALPSEVSAARLILESLVVVHKGLYKKGVVIMEAALDL